MKLRTAFFLSLLAVVLVMAVPAAFGVRHLGEVRSLALDLRERAAEAALVVGEARADLERLDRYQRAHVATGTPELADRTRATLDSLELHIDRLADAGYADAVRSTAPPIASLRAVSELTLLLMESGSAEAATGLLRTGVAPLLGDATASVTELASAVDEATAAQTARAELMAARAQRTLTTALLLALLTAIGLAALAAGFLTRPLERLSTAMDRVAGGSFTLPESLPYERRDEVGALFRSFRSMTLQLRDLDRMKAELVSVASHDLKTPVNVIAGYAELLSEELQSSADDRQREILASLLRQSRVLSARANQLLEVSRIEASGLRLGLEEINVRHFTAEVARAHRAAAAEHGIDLDVEVEDSAPTFLIADPDCLRQDVFAHLFQNALRFTPRGGWVRLRASGDGGVLHFELHDNGASIPPESLAHAFDRYYHGDPLPGRIGGLGLPIARAAAEAHGGTLQAASPSSGGALFRVTLPIHSSVPARTPPTAHEPA